MADVTPKDKLLHMVAGGAISCVAVWFLGTHGVWLGLIAGAVKEIRDKVTGKGTPEFLDFAATALPSIFIYIAILMSRKDDGLLDLLINYLSK